MNQSRRSPYIAAVLCLTFSPCFAPRGAVAAEADVNARRVSGEIVEIGTVTSRGIPDEHTVVILRTEQGERLYADLGPAIQFEDLELARGDRITVNGSISYVQGRLILVARQVLAHNQTIDVQPGPMPLRREDAP